MKIDSLAVCNYRGLSKVELENLSPITVLLGRNNTGKSALLEAFALASTSSAGWFDARGTDILETIVNRRGGWDYADMMVRIGEQKATMNMTKDGTSSMLEISSSLEALSQNLRAGFASLINGHVDSLMRRYMEIASQRGERSSVQLRSAERTAIEVFNRLKSTLARRIKAYVACENKSEKNNALAAVIGQVREFSDTIEPEFQDIVRYGPYFEPDAIIRSTPSEESETIFMLSPSREYLAHLQKSLAKSGELINLIELLRERLDYFTDLREVDKDFLVFIKGLKKPVPLDSMGDGFRAQIALLAGTLMSKGGLVLMEEPEIRLHPGFMSSVADQISDSAKIGGGQYVVSTHSLEFLKYLLECDPKLVKVVQMSRIPKTAATEYEVIEGGEASERTKKFEEDLRGP